MHNKYNNNKHNNVISTYMYRSTCSINIGIEYQFGIFVTHIPTLTGT